MASARDLKSLVPKGTCGLDSHPRHPFMRWESKGAATLLMDVGPTNRRANFPLERRLADRSPERERGAKAPIPTPGLIN